MIKIFVLPTVLVVIGTAGGFYFGVQSAAAHYQDRKQLFTHIRQLEQANSYIRSSMEKGEVETKALVLQDIRFHLLGARLYLSKVNAHSKAEACELVRRVGANYQQISQYGQPFGIDQDTQEIFRDSGQCMTW